MVNVGSFLPTRTLPRESLEMTPGSAKGVDTWVMRSLLQIQLLPVLITKTTHAVSMGCDCQNHNWPWPTLQTLEGFVVSSWEIIFFILTTLPGRNRQLGQEFSSWALDRLFWDTQHIIARRSQKAAWYKKVWKQVLVSFALAWNAAATEWLPRPETSVNDTSLCKWKNPRNLARTTVFL